MQLQTKMKTINDFNFNNKKAIIRVDFNVPLNDQFQVTDDNRIVAAKPTIDKIVNDGGVAILMSHLGRPKNGPEDKFSLKHIVSKVAEVLGRKVTYVNDTVQARVEEIVASAHPGVVVLLENCRHYKHEEARDEAFAEKLSKLRDVYVNHALGTVHRARDSTTIVAKFF